MKLLPALFLAMTIFACNNNKKQEKEKPSDPEPIANELVLDKLVGTWQSEDGTSFERWTKVNSNYQTAGFSVKGSDTTWNERGLVYLEVEGWVFENTVSGQNENKPVKFKATLLNENTVQFSNPAHDFPTDINYTVRNAKTLNAFIVGPSEKGGKDTIPFNFIRVK